MKRTFYLLFSLIGLALIGVTNRGHAQSAIHGTTQIHSGGHLGVYNSLSFVSGYVITPRNEPTANILWTAGATYSGASNSSHVNGYAEKAGTDAFMFPVGDGTKLRMAGISAPASAGNYRAAYFSTSPSSATAPTGGPFPTTNLGTGVTAVSTTEYWDIDGSGSVNLTLTWDAGSSLSALVGGDVSKLAIVGYNTSTSKWEKLTTSPASGTASLTGPGSLTATGVTPNNYAAFTFGSTLPNAVNLVTTKVGPASLSQFTPFSYTMVVKNTGAITSSGALTVVDTLKNGLKFVSGSGTGWTVTKTGADGSGNEIVTATSNTTLATGNASSFTLTVNPTVAGNVSNQSWTNGGGTTGGPFGSGPTESQAGATGTPNGTVTGPTQVQPKPNLVTTKVASGTIIQGSNFNYTFTVKNTGSLASSGAITILDTLKSGLTYVSGSGTGWSFTQTGTDGSGNAIVQATSSTPIAVSATSNYTLTVKPTTAGSISNLAWTSGGGMPGGPYKSGPSEGQAGSASNPYSGTATESNVTPGTPCAPIEPGVASASAASVQTGGSASFTLSGNGAGTTTWAIFPNNGVSPNTGSGTSTSNVTFTQAGEYQIIFTTTSATSATCNQPSTAVATAEFKVTSPNPLCAYPGASSVSVSPTSAAIAAGANASFTLNGGTPNSSVQWYVLPTTGVTPTAGSGTTTSSVLFNNAGLYNVVFVMTNLGDGNCVPVQKSSSALIAVGLNACAPPTPIVLTSTATSNTSNVGQAVTVSATGGVPNQGSLSWIVTNASNTTIASGTGSPANVTFTQPGLYTFTYRATNSSIPTGCTSPVTITKSITHLVTGTAPGVVVAAKVLLAGPLNGTQMTTNLRNNNLIPTTDPYGKGATTTAAVVGSSSPTGSNAIVDWVLIELRSSASAVVESHAALLQADGDVVSTDGTSPVSFSATAGNYFVSIKHRNHLGVMTATALPLTSTATTVDFTLPSTATYGSYAQRAVGSVMALWAGNAAPTPGNEQIRYSGPNNEPLAISNAVTAGGKAITSTTPLGYWAADLDLNGTVRYAGPSNDLNIVSGSIINYPGNATKAITYPIAQTFN